jgi:L-iditol 2-dehydrogenase
MTGMDAAVLHGIHDLRVETVPAPKHPGPHDVLIAIRAVGLCGSDVHYWHEGRIGPFVVTKPIILGHECSGEVVEVGEHVRHLRRGDRVAIEPGVPCRRCAYCVTGRYNLCDQMRFFATPPIDGALAQIVEHPADLSFKMPESMTYDEGAMLEPLSVGIYACRRGGVQPGKSVLIVGAGPVGLLCLLAAQAAGASRILAIDLKDDRLAKAEDLGAAYTFRGDAPDLSERLEHATNGDGIDIVLECSGAPSAVRRSVDLVRRGGTVVWVGMGPESFEFPTLTVGMKELDVKGLFRYAHTWPTAIELVSSGRIDVKPLITHRFPLSDVVQAFELTQTGADGAIKADATRLSTSLSTIGIIETVEGALSAGRTVLSGSRDLRLPPTEESRPYLHRGGHRKLRS